MKYLLLLVAFHSLCARAQVFDDFSDGDLTQDPAWNYNPGDWIINAGSQLQSACTTANHRFAISTAMPDAFANWRFSVQLDFATSSTNYLDVYLLHDEIDLLSTTGTGYFIRLGGTQDEISLLLKSPSGETMLINGVDGSLSGSSHAVDLEVTRSTAGLFTLKRKTAGGTWFTEGRATDLTLTTPGWLGFSVKQSTSSFFEKHFINHVLVTNYVPDTTPPAVLHVVATDTGKIRIYFSEEVNPDDAINPFNYLCDGGVGLPEHIIRDPFDPSVYELRFFQDLPPRTWLQLQVSGIRDMEDNLMLPANIPFGYAPPEFGSVVIHEFMADPLPSAGMPEAEWIEIRNPHNFPVWLDRWKICRSPGACATLPGHYLPADGLLILTSASAAHQLLPYGDVLPLNNFPTIPNDTGELYLQDANGNIIHAVGYTDEWYGDNFKKQGGFSLEMKDPLLPCLQQVNWSATLHTAGATPGNINSVAQTMEDNTPPEVLRVWVTDSVTVFIEFSEPIQKTTVSPAAFSIQDIPQNVLTTEVVSPMQTHVILTLSSPLTPGSVGGLFINGITDCAGNSVIQSRSLRLGIPEVAEAGDIIINELLFHPHSGESDFIELYNNSMKVIDVGMLSLANRNTSGEISNIVRIHHEPWLLFPGEYMVITAEPSFIRNRYVCENPHMFIRQSTPSWNNDKGNAIILNQYGVVLDELPYNKNWHAPLVNNPQGVSLERIRFNGPSHDPSNWHSAAFSAGYATPTALNSQALIAAAVPGSLTLEPSIIHLPHDGRNDFTLIQYQFDLPGFVANVIIFDMNGRKVRHLCRSVLCGVKGSWKWDGLGENGKLLPTGMYIIMTEALHPNGKKVREKLVATVVQSP